MDAVLHRDAAFLEYVGELAHRMLRLRCRQTVTGHEHDFVRVSELRRDVFETDFTHRSLLLTGGLGRCRTAKRAKQNVRHRTIHRAAHQYRKYESGEAVERAG